MAKECVDQLIYTFNRRDIVIMKKRLVSILLTAIMVLGAFGTFAFAENEAPAAGSTDGQGI